MGDVGMVGKIHVLEDDGATIKFEYMDGALSGRYALRRGGDPLRSIYDSNFIVVPTSTSLDILTSLRKQKIRI